MSDGDLDDAASYADALDAKRLSQRIAAVTNRRPKPVPVPKADGTVLLRGRRRADRLEKAGDRRAGERRTRA